MTEKVRIHAKKLESEQKYSNSCKQKPNFNSSGYPADGILHLQRTAGNKAVQRLIKSRALQAKLRNGQPNDIYEQEADAVAEQAIRISDPVLQRKCEKCDEDEEKVLRAKESQGKLPVTQGYNMPSVVHKILRSPGQPLDSATRAFMEPYFAHDFSGVRVHTDDLAAAQAQLIHARAFTLGSDVFFGRNEYMPMTSIGRHLLAHELTHVIQQQTGIQVQRQKIPPELQTSLNLRGMKFEELQARHDLIVSTILELQKATPNRTTLEIGFLQEEAGRIGNEIGRREALSAGRTFSDEDVTQMKNYFVKNTQKDKPRNCIDTMNDGLQLLYRDKKQKVGDSVDKTMGSLQGAGRAGEARVIEFEDKKGRVSRSGSLYPERVHESVWDAILQMNGKDVGWSVFGMGPADMSHSVTLTLDNNDPAHPIVYWSDQWKEKAGWKAFDRTGLDAEVARVTQIIWNQKDDRHKPNTRVTLWRLKRNVQASNAPKP